MRMRAFLIAACWAGAVTLPAAWLLPDWAALSPGYPLSALALMGGVIFGLGAYINGACAFGTLAHLSGGNTNFLGTMAGVMAGAIAAPLAFDLPDDPTPSAFTDPSVIPLGALAVFLIVAAWATWRHYRAQGLKQRSARRIRRITLGLRPATAMAVIGIAGGLLYSIAGDWTYMMVLSNRAARLINPAFPGSSWAALVGTAALLIGGIVAALSSGRFKLSRPRLNSVVKTFAGGTIMSFAAAIIPGGNDVLLLNGLPSLAPHALLAYAAMTAALVGLFYVKRWRS